MFRRISHCKHILHTRITLQLHKIQSIRQRLRYNHTLFDYSTAAHTYTIEQKHRQRLEKCFRLPFSGFRIRLPGCRVL
jgi:hypothetical protein